MCQEKLYRVNQDSAIHLILSHDILMNNMEKCGLNSSIVRLFTSIRLIQKLVAI